MIEKSIDLISILEEAINKNELYNTGTNGEKLFSEFTKEDFSEILNYVEVYGKKINAIKFISYCVREFWNHFNHCNFNKHLWEKNFVKFNYLEVIINKLQEIVFSYDELFQKDRFDEAFSLFRNYVELSSILFASSIDIDFFNKYTSKSESNDEYKKLWFRYLKPQKVVELLKKHPRKTNEQLINYAVGRFAGFQREKLYNYTSSITHGKFSHIIDLEKKEQNEISIMVIDYLVNSTLLIHLVTHGYIEYPSEKEERKLHILVQIWIEILYKHLLI